MPAPAAASDEDLMLAYAAGDAASFDRLYARHKGGIYRYLLRQCATAGIAEQLFQDVWMHLIRARASYVPSAKFSTWLYRLAHNRLIDHFRAAGHVALVSIDDEQHVDAIDLLPAARHDEPEARAANRQLGERIKAAVAALPAVQRDAFLLQQEAELSVQEIAELTGVGVETAKSRLRYAVARLRAELGDLKDTGPDHRPDDRPKHGLTHGPTHGPSNPASDRNMDTQ